MYSVAHVLNPDFARSWHECVAIVQEAASLLQPGLTLPDPDDLVFDEQGALTFGFGSESSRDPVVALATLLQKLLVDVEAPGGLRDIAVENSGPNPAHASVTSFSRALAFYERPNRADDLRALSGRLRGSPVKSAMDLEFERLREKVAGSPEPEAVEQEQKKEKKRKKRSAPPIRLTKRQQQIIGAGIAAGLLIGLSGVLLQRDPGIVRNAVAKVDDGVAQAVAAGLDRLGIAKSASAAPVPGEPVEQARVSPRPSRTAATSGRSDARRDSATSSRTQASPAVRNEPDNASRPLAASQSARTAIPVSIPLEVPLVATLPTPPAEPASFVPLAAVYSPEDRRVEPPVLLRPQMPREPKPGDDTGYFDLIVDENGTVEQVKLLSPTRRFHDRMLVAAAKAWKFRPALLDGQPVRYQIRIPIILTGMP
jgi:hypothetical protein